jgi:hypothetical protein
MQVWQTAHNRQEPEEAIMTYLFLLPFDILPKIPKLCTSSLGNIFIGVDSQVAEEQERVEHES